MSGPSFSISGKPVTVTPTAITNGVTFWPDLDLAEFQKVRTLPADLPPETAGVALLAAIAEVNDALADVVTYWNAKACERAADVPASAAAGVLRFYKLNAADVVVVPAGTLVQTERINGVVYVLAVNEDVTLPAGVESGLVPVTATGNGSGYNLAPGYYRILPVAVAGIASAVNEDEWLITPGANEESDDELRDRTRNQFNLVGNYHSDAIYRSMIASVLGLSVDRIYFLHDAPRGPGTANAYLLLDSGEISQPFIDAVNDYVNTQGHHGHGDDLQCYAMPETSHTLAVTVYVKSVENMEAEDLSALKTGITDLIRCAFRENANYDVKKTQPYSRYSFSNLGREIHKAFPVVDSLHFSLTDIVSELSVPRLSGLTVEIEND